MVRAGLVVSFKGGWQGGVNYVRNLLSCYQKYPEPDVKLDVFTVHTEEASVYQCDAIEIHALTSGVPRWNYARRAARRFLGYDPATVSLFKRVGLDLLSHFGLGGQKSIKTLLWQPDFQHQFYPQFFSHEECARRDAVITANVKRWGHILLSSHAAANDFRRFYPQLIEAQTHVLHFSSAAILDAEPVSREELESQFPVREPYFFLPNQFWKHKNHGVVVEALRVAPAEIRVICTGSMEDYRDPGYVAGLLDKVKQAGLEQRFVCLGTVTYATLVSLMHYSLAVVQPSLFEGWSTSVEEAKAMCKRIILSNIDVHIEQAPERGTFFSPDSPEELAAALKHIYEEFSPEIEQDSITQRSRNRAKREQGWIKDYAEILKTVAKQ